MPRRPTARYCRLGKSAGFCSLGTQRSLTSSPAAKERDPHCRHTRSIPDEEDRPFDRAKMAVIESDNISMRLFCDPTLRNTLLNPCTSDLPSKMLIGSARLHLPLDTTDQDPLSTSAGTAGTDRVLRDGSACTRPK